ncbi:MAG: 30S ribosomal protein S17 [uncultured bacterium]|nr:MAG: 30S ribosomal protein S17 [uncultured bacterium]
MSEKSTKVSKDSKNKSDNKINRVFKGVVVSDKMDKTIVVSIHRMKQHAKYNKRYGVSKLYPVHDEHNKFKKGDEVRFAECRPLSKTKRWYVLDDKTKK